MTQIQECQQNGVFALKSLLNREPNLACPARTPFLGEAVEGHPNRLDAEVALKIVFGVVSDRSGLRTFRARLFQASTESP